MRILGIETSCDETAAAVVEDGKRILSNVVHSQIAMHQQYGGVFPEMACRSHIEKLTPIVHAALDQSGFSLEEMDALAVTQGPGLIGALLIGVNFASSLSFASKLPLIPVNHVEAHLYAAFMELQDPVTFPVLGLVVSGGHTFMAVMESFTSYRIVGRTVDDAVGEAFDKTARLLGLPYPGGPQIQALALQGDPKRFSLKAPQVKGQPLNFSLSGLKTSVLYAVKGQDALSLKESLSSQDKADLAASFQHVVVEDLFAKATRAAQQFSCHAIAVGGGVSANQALRARFACSSLPAFFSSLPLAVDNAAMVAGLAYHLQDRACREAIFLEPFASLPMVSP